MRRVEGGPSGMIPSQTLSDLSKDQSRTPIAAVGVTIVYERLLASPITNLAVPCARLRTIVPDFFGPAYTKRSSLSVEDGPIVTFVLSSINNPALLSTRVRTPSSR